MNIGDEIQYIGSIGPKGIKIRYSKIIAKDDEKGIVELENSMRLRFLYKSDEPWSPWVTYSNMANGKKILLNAE